MKSLLNDVESFVNIKSNKNNCTSAGMIGSKNSSLHAICSFSTVAQYSSIDSSLVFKTIGLMIANMCTLRDPKLIKMHIKPNTGPLRCEFVISFMNTGTTTLIAPDATPLIILQKIKT